MAALPNVVQLRIIFRTHANHKWRIVFDDAQNVVVVDLAKISFDR